MKKIKQHWKLIFPFSIVLIVASLYFGIEQYQVYKEQQVKDYYREFLTYTPPQKIKQSKFLDKQTVAIEWERTDKEADRYIPKQNITYKFLNARSGAAASVSNFIITEQRRLRGEVRSYGITKGETSPIQVRNTLEKGEYWSVKVYKKRGQKFIAPTEIDIPKIVKKHNPAYFPYGIQVVERERKSYLMISIRPFSRSDKKVKNTDYFLYVDLDTQKIVDLPVSSSGKLPISERDIRLSSFSTLTDLDSQLDKQGITFSNDNGSIGLTKKGIKNSKNWQIAKKYPEVYKILKNGGHLYLMKDRMDMDYTAKILQLFVPKGYDIFDGVTIPAYYSIDGKERQVKSYEEFKQYYKIQ